MFNTDVFNQVKENIDISTVIKHYGIEVGRNNSFCCPFHDEKRASAFIKNDYFHCFACGVGGDVIKFTALMHKCQNIKACEILIRDFNLPVSTKISGLSKAEYREAKAKQNERISEKQTESRNEKIINMFYSRMSRIFKYLDFGKRKMKPPEKQCMTALRHFETFNYFYERFKENPEKFIEESGIEVIEKYERIISADDN